jgi:tetratricopeptide (TPR) repeat protein
VSGQGASSTASLCGLVFATALGVACAGAGGAADFGRADEPSLWIGTSEATDVRAVIAREPGCGALLTDGLDAAALGLFGLEAGTERGRDDVAALAAAFDRVAGNLPPVRLGPAEGPVLDGEVAGRTRCAGLDPLRVLVERAVPARVRFAPAGEVVAKAMARGEAELNRGRAPEARIAFAEALAHDARVPAPALAIGRAYFREERFSEATGSFAELLSRFPSSAPVHAALADGLRREGRRLDAADAWSKAIALAPGEALLVRRAAADPYVEMRPSIGPPAVRGEDGAWRLRPSRGRDAGAGMSPEEATAARAEGEAYAACKEAFRTSPAVAEALLGQSLVPWRWSPEEERVCTAVWLRSYLRHRDSGRPEDSGLDDLLLIAEKGFLRERALFDIGARVHPLAGALLDEASRARLFAFVAGHRVMRRRQGGWLF